MKQQKYASKAADLKPMIMLSPNNAAASRVSLLALCYYKSIMYCIFAVISLYIDNKVLGTFCVFFLFLSGSLTGSILAQHCWTGCDSNYRTKRCDIPEY